MHTPNTSNLWSWIDHHATARPTDLALIDLSQAQARQWSWAALKAEIVRAHARLERSVSSLRPGDAVAACASNCAELLIAQAVCARAGLIYAPLNVRLSQAELELTLDELKPSALLMGHQRHLRPATSLTALPITLMSAPDDLQGPVPKALPDDPQRLALLLYTSGSTGHSKGAVFDHGSFAASVRQFVEVLGLDQDTINLAIAPLYHVAGLGVLTLPTLFAGGANIITSTERSPALWPLVEAYKITHTFGVPTLWQRWLEGTAPQRHTLRLGVIGGAPSDPALHRRWWSCGVELCVGYGMTEAAPMVTLARRDVLERSPMSVGVAGPLVQLEVRDDAGHKLAARQTGELYVRAPNLMRGYWPGHHRGLGLGHDGALATCDLAMIDEQGQVTLMGRKDDLIITGGLKVYPEEVERALRAMDEIEDVAVLGRDDDPEYGQRVIACVVWGVDEAARPSLEQLRSRLEPTLARYKHPKVLVALLALPRLGSGKLDRLALAKRLDEHSALTSR